MKRIIAITLMLIVTLTGCKAELTNEPTYMSTEPDYNDEQRRNGDSDVGNGQSADEMPVTEKIVIITNPRGYEEFEFRSAEAMVRRFGDEQVVHKTWPHRGADADGIIRGILQEVMEDQEVGALIINQPFADYTYVVEALQYLRDDVFVVYIPGFHFERVTDVAASADLIIQTSVQRLGEAFVMQAISMGADTIVHYSFPRHMAIPAFAMRRDSMKAAARREGVSFIELETLDPLSDTRHDLVPMFITQDIPRQVHRLGLNTAFFGTECLMQNQIISQTIATGAIFVSTCCPSPYHEYPEAVGIEYGHRFPLSELIQVIDEAVDAVGMAGRISSQAVPDSMIWTTIGLLYAMEWLSGSTPQERGVIDLEVLNRMAREHTAQLGVDAAITLETLLYEGEIIEHYIMGDINYHVFGSR